MNELPSRAAERTRRRARKLAAEIKALRVSAAELERFSVHRSRCCWLRSVDPCDCGLDETRAKLRGYGVPLEGR